MDRTKGPPTATFIVRLWLADGNETKRTWRGQVEHIQSGEKEYVRGMAQVTSFIEKHFAEEGSGTRLGGIR
jgi:hypothetical protein